MSATAAPPSLSGAWQRAADGNCLSIDGDFLRLMVKDVGAGLKHDILSESFWCAKVLKRQQMTQK